jgi:hypothetical protein
MRGDLETAKNMITSLYDSIPRQIAARAHTGSSDLQPQIDALSSPYAQSEAYLLSSREHALQGKFSTAVQMAEKGASMLELSGYDATDQLIMNLQFQKLFRLIKILIANHLIDAATKVAQLIPADKEKKTALDYIKENSNS